MNSTDDSGADPLPSVTVVIPAYNQQRYLKDAVVSVQKQTYRGPIAIVVLDDGSIDDTLSLARQLAADDARIRVETQSNTGRVGARNRLVDLSDTELIAWLDGDDLASPQWLADGISVLNRNPNCAAASGQGYAMTATGEPIGPIDHHPLTSEAIKQRHLAGHANAFFQSCVVTRKSMILDAGGYRDDYPAGEDYDLWLRIGELADLQNTDQCVLYYRVHAASANSTISVDQRLQGLASANEARRKRGLAPLPDGQEEIPHPTKDDWNRRIYWINIALKSGNPRTGLQLVREALKKHPRSLLLWLALLAAAGDSVLLFGNRTSRFRPGVEARIGSLPWLSCFRFGRWLNRLRRRLRQK